MILVLGLNCGHDAAACVVTASGVVAAVAEERLLRVKHVEGAPLRSIAAVLDITGLPADGSGIDAVAVNAPEHFTGLDALREALPGCATVPWHIGPSHHLLHACYAAAACGVPEPLVLVIDGSGYSFRLHKPATPPQLLGDPPRHPDACEALTAYRFGPDGRCDVLLKDWGQWVENTDERYRFPSLGHMYSLAAQHLFGSWTHAGKVMGLAPYGNPGGIPGEIVTCTADGVRVDTDWILSLPKVDRSQPMETVPLACDVAAKVQAELERAIRHLVGLLYERSPADTLCLTGGVALNSVCNGILAREGPFPGLFVTPAAGDSGVAIGAGAYAYRALTGALPDLSSTVEFLGPRYNAAAVRAALGRRPALTHTEVGAVGARIARDVADGRFVGLFEGRSEFGPRALGHRSILADPRRAEVKELLNARVKFREAFRPYAACIPDSALGDWFELGRPSPHMLLVAHIRPDARARIPAVTHIDGTCRLQTVTDAEDGALAVAVREFGRLTGVPVLLNTSLNIKGEPICETPDEALDCMERSDLDVLYVEGHRVTRCEPGGAA